MLSPDENPFITAHKPVEDGFPFVVETDSLADSMGLRLPNRSLYLLQGKVGAGKSLIAQRLIHGMVQNGVKVLVITTELTTRGWIEQMESIGYGMTEAMRMGQVMVLSRYGNYGKSLPTDVHSCCVRTQRKWIIRFFTPCGLRQRSSWTWKTH